LVIRNGRRARVGIVMERDRTLIIDQGRMTGGRLIIKIDHAAGACICDGCIRRRGIVIEPVSAHIIRNRSLRRGGRIVEVGAPEFETTATPRLELFSNSVTPWLILIIVAFAAVALSPKDGVPSYVLRRIHLVEESGSCCAGVIHKESDPAVVMDRLSDSGFVGDTVARQSEKQLSRHRNLVGGCSGIKSEAVKLGDACIAP